MLKSKIEPFLDEIVSKYQNGYSAEKLSREYGVSPAIIKKFLKRLNIDLRISKLYGKEKEIIELYKSGLSAEKISLKYNVSKPTILTLLRNSAVKRRELTEARRIYSIDENTFDVIDTEEKAYFLGLLYADGNNFPEKNLITLGLEKTDRYMIQRFKDLVKSQAPLKYRKGKENQRDEVIFTITNKHMSSTFTNIGIVKNKTFKIVFPSWLPKELERHFIRGYFDGDGGITLTKESLEVTFAGTEELLLEIQKILMRECELPKTKLDRRYPDRDNNIRSLRYSGRLQILRIFDYMYNESSLFLTRKYENFIAIQHNNVQQKKEYSESHCWQYDIRIKKLDQDLLELNFTEEKMKSLKTSDFGFQVITHPSADQYKEIKEFIIKYEWLGRMPNRPTHFFVVKLKETQTLAAVVIMSTPTMFSHILGKENKHLERLISRGACASWTPKNLGSYIIMQAIRWVVKNTEFRIFSAYADPEAREIGAIYQACNFIYLGRNHRKKAELYLDLENPQKGWFSERHFTHRAAYIRYIKKLGMYDLFVANPHWFLNYTLNWDEVPRSISDKIKKEIIDTKNRCIRRITQPKHKYIYILGKNKKETKYYRNLFLEINPKLAKLNYPKREDKNNGSINNI